MTSAPRAAAQGHDQVVAVLADAGAGLDAQGLHGTTPLQLAVRPHPRPRTRARPSNRRPTPSSRPRTPAHAAKKISF